MEPALISPSIERVGNALKLAVDTEDEYHSCVYELAPKNGLSWTIIVDAEPTEIFGCGITTIMGPATCASPTEREGETIFLWSNGNAWTVGFTDRNLPNCVGFGRGDVLKCILMPDNFSVLLNEEPYFSTRTFNGRKLSLWQWRPIILLAGLGMRVTVDCSPVPASVLADYTSLSKPCHAQVFELGACTCRAT